jgi:predicted ArsR family transcriptional regulator
MKEKIILTDNGERLLSFLQKNNSTWTGKELEAITGIKGIYFVINSLTRNGLVEYVDNVDKEVINCKGEKVIRPYKAYHLTEKGRSFIIN